MKSNGQDAVVQSPFDPERPYTPGKDPIRDAWYTTFFIENHLDYYAYPDHVDSPEQVRFMVYTEMDERYYPCSDRMFGAIMRREKSPFLQEQYEAVLNRILDLIEKQIEDPWDKTFLRTLIKTKYEHETRDALMIPSRLEKRLLKIYIDRTQIQDPYLSEKRHRNMRAFRALKSEVFQKALNHVDTRLPETPPTSLIEIRERVEFLKLSRLFTLSVDNALWDSDKILEYTVEDYLELFSRPFSGDGVEVLWKFLKVQREGASGIPQPKKLLWLADEAGEVIVDLAIVRYLAQLGHKIIMAFKDGPLFKKIDFFDAQEEVTLCRELEGALLIHEKSLEKNELVNILKGDKDVMAISDGTRENFNLVFVSTTFARVFKEVDGVISKGLDQRRRIFDTHFRFTQDMYSIARDEDGSTSIRFKAKHPDVIKFSYKDLERKARTMIAEMEKAKREGMTVMFYSGIIGSIPGKEAMAKKIMSVYIQHLRNQSSSTYIINPSEHSEPGMDADDLMYMWEIVQRSGLIDIWRFQRYDDIVDAFEIMKMRIPPEWVGKDATFSTGCTKEMKIALEVQEKRREMQIIGPSREKFLRRQEYAIGKMYDRQLDRIRAG